MIIRVWRYVKQLNFNVLKQNIFKELRVRLKQPPRITVLNQSFLLRHKNHQLETVTQIK